MVGYYGILLPEFVESSHMARIVSDKVKFFCEQQETQKLPSWTGQIKLGHIDNWKVGERDGRRREGGLGSQHGIFSKNILRVSSQYIIMSLVTGSKRIKTHIRQRNYRRLSSTFSITEIKILLI